MTFEFSTPNRHPSQHDVLELACTPIPVVRIAFIGLGKRGKESFNHYLYMDKVQIVAICDINLEHIEEAKQKLAEHSRPSAAIYTAVDDWKTICERQDIDLVYVCTHWKLHAPIAVHAMRCGKHVALEVPAALTIRECWMLVDTAEITQRHCIMLENCCYDRFGMAVMQMAQKGLLGEIVHCEGGYIHDLRRLDFIKKPSYLDTWNQAGNPYPTHGIGPICQLLNIHRGDRLDYIVSCSSNQLTVPKVQYEPSKQFILGNMNTSIIKTIKGKTIVLQHDISSPRPYSRNYLVSGTLGFAEKRYEAIVALDKGDGAELLVQKDLERLLTEYDHPFYKDLGEQAVKVGSHGGMDFIMDYRLIYCLNHGLPLDMDVYDAAEWSSIVELSAKSVELGSTPVRIPDFTRGDWKRLSHLSFASEPLAKCAN